MCRYKHILLFLLGAAFLGGDTPDSHRRADAVLFPAFVSACNDYSTQHHPDELGHLQKLDKGDRERLEVANRAWREFYEAMK
jgi:hypothetical protein